jgi:large subunit ribosomal protein L23
MNAFEVIRKPHLSEKATDQRENGGFYTFVVDRKAGKKDIAEAIEKIYEVKVKTIKTHIRRGKIKKRGRIHSDPKARKFAMIQLKDGQKLPLFDEQ